MGEFQVIEQVFSTKQNQNIKEALTGALSILNIEQENRAIVWKPEQQAWTVFFTGEYDNFVNRFWQEHDLYCFAMAKKEMSSLKTCIGMIPISPLKSKIDDQILEMLTLSCTATELTIETVSLLGESPPQLSLLLNVIK